MTSEVPSVLFVCLGNICRSPACEGIARKVAGDRINVDSCGTASYHTGESPDSRSQKACRGIGVDISKHRARQIRSSDWTSFDLIVALDDSVLQDLQFDRPQNAKAKLVLFNAPHGVDDPYYGGQNGFETMAHLIEEKMGPFLEEFLHSVKA
mgnify:CR=1 FL=1